jgi:chorismate synthase
VKLDTNALLRGTGRKTTVDIRPLASQADLRACVALQRRTWGEDFADVVPGSILKIAARLSGVVAGAFDRGGTLLGFVFGLTGVERGAIVHWSHMLGVAPEAQNQGIGRGLKEFQRLAVAKVGAKTIYWTFDPLVARNAHLNFNVLGVRATDYVQDMYGESASPLHRGIGTDRLIVSWPVEDALVEARRREIASQVEGPDTIRIETPADIAALQLSDMPAAREWRERMRGAFQKALAQGYGIQGFRVDADAGNGYYLLRRNP